MVLLLLGGCVRESESDGAAGSVRVLFPRQAVTSAELAILVNTNDPQSVAVAAYYQEKRRIPPQNVIRLAFDPSGAVLARDGFAPLKAQIDAATPPEVQAYAITWTTPYRVDCMSMTSAVALGFDAKYCKVGTGTCSATAPVAYYDSSSTRPHDDLGIRPAMMLAAASVDDARRLVDKGVAADATYPGGNGYFIRTNDAARSARWPEFKQTVTTWNGQMSLSLDYIDNSMGNGANHVRDKTDVLFYFTSLASVDAIGTNSYLPGAVADHMTSFGGRVPSSSQMSAVRWLEAGVTASYGTVVEPCAFPTKFPNAGVLLSHYLRGATIVEAYWKTVLWPGEGLFIGEPLAQPWGSSFTYTDGTLTLRTVLVPGKRYAVEATREEGQPYEVVKDGISAFAVQVTTIVILDAPPGLYRLVERPL